METIEIARDILIKLLGEPRGHNDTSDSLARTAGRMARIMKKEAYSEKPIAEPDQPAGKPDQSLCDHFSVGLLKVAQVGGCNYCARSGHDQVFAIRGSRNGSIVVRFCPKCWNDLKKQMSWLKNLTMGG